MAVSREMFMINTFFFKSGDQTLGFSYAKQVFYHKAHAQLLGFCFALLIFEIGSFC